MGLYSKLIEVQVELKAPKNQHNSFGNYNYRSCEDILEAVKPLLKSKGLAITISDGIESIGNRVYVSATVTLHDTESAEEKQVKAYARESESKKGMDDSQITGCASSYARKYALNGLFCIDDTKDADTMDNSKETKKYICEECGKEFVAFDWKGKHYTVEEAYSVAIKKGNGRALCRDCRKKLGL